MPALLELDQQGTLLDRDPGGREHLLDRAGGGGACHRGAAFELPGEGEALLPLLKPGFIAGWIYIVIVSVRELSSSILLYSPGTEVVSIVIWELWQNGQYVELSALGVMMIVGLFCFVMVAQFIGRKLGIKEA